MCSTHLRKVGTWPLSARTTHNLTPWPHSINKQSTYTQPKEDDVNETYISHINLHYIIIIWNFHDTHTNWGPVENKQRPCAWHTQAKWGLITRRAHNAIIDSYVINYCSNYTLVHGVNGAVHHLDTTKLYYTKCAWMCFDTHGSKWGPSALLTHTDNWGLEHTPLNHDNQTKLTQLFDKWGKVGTFDSKWYFRYLWYFRPFRTV